jgi:hypothetical protein
VQALLDRFGVCGWPRGQSPRSRNDAGRESSTALSDERGG